MRISIARRALLLAAISASTLAAAVLTTVQGSGVKQDDGLESGRHAYEASDYGRAAQLLQEAAARNPQNAEIQLLLASARSGFRHDRRKVGEFPFQVGFLAFEVINLRLGQLHLHAPRLVLR